MNSPNTYPLDDDSLAYVRSMLVNGLSNPEFSYSITVNKQPLQFCKRATDIEKFDEVARQYAETGFVYCIDVTARYSERGNSGKRIVLAGEKPDGHYDPHSLGGYSDYQTSSQKQREQELVERVRTEFKLEAQEKEIVLLRQTIEHLTEQLKKSEEFANEVEKLCTDLKAKSQDKGTLEQIGEFIGNVAKYAPGLLKNTPLEGVAKPPAPVQQLGNTTATPKTQAQPKQPSKAQYDGETQMLIDRLLRLKPYLSLHEFVACFNLIAVLTHHKPLIADLYELAQDEVQRRQSTSPKQPVPTSQQQGKQNEKQQEQGPIQLSEDEERDRDENMPPVG